MDNFHISGTRMYFNISLCIHNVRILLEYRNTSELVAALHVDVSVSYILCIPCLSKFDFTTIGSIVLLVLKCCLSHSVESLRVFSIICHKIKPFNAKLDLHIL